ncbi:MAG: glycosyltransferase family A protein [Candidatus Pacebacteria bacterium]|nr:glycosyltransferase family A protein [Candidatus Paceibacterota bacterium]MDD5357047.1 glycosyltransferase family A protein [Candidatus Paceibacterota bacterium]
MKNREKHPLVSVIVPVYNGERFLKGALESILAQSYAHLEILVIDDGSTDGTAAIAQSFPNVTYFFQKNRGVAAARNKGIRMATGEVLAFLDADDLWPKHRLERMVSKIASLDAPQMVIGTTKLSLFEKSGKYRKEIKSSEKPKIFSFVGAAIFTRHVFTSIGVFRKMRFAESVDLFFRIKEKNIPTTVIRDITLINRKRSGSITAEKSEDDLFGHVALALKRHLHRANGK